MSVPRSRRFHREYSKTFLDITVLVIFVFLENQKLKRTVQRIQEINGAVGLLLFNRKYKVNEWVTRIRFTA